VEPSQRGQRFQKTHARALEEASPRVDIITAYEPDLEHFENDFRTRRKK